eukprot:1541545-Prymnesium_polylepis.1
MSGKAAASPGSCGSSTPRCSPPARRSSASDSSVLRQPTCTTMRLGSPLLSASICVEENEEASCSSRLVMITWPTPWQPLGSTSSISAELVTLSKTISHGKRARKRRARTSATTSSLRSPCTPMPLSPAHEAVPHATCSVAPGLDSKAPTARCGLSVARCTKVTVAKLDCQLRLAHATHANQLERCESSLFTCTGHRRVRAGKLGVAPHKLSVAWRDAPHATNDPTHPTPREVLGVASLVEARARTMLTKHSIDLGVARPVQPRPPAHRRVVQPVARPAARRAHPACRQFGTSTLEAADHARIDVRLTDWMLLGRSVSLARHLSRLGGCRGYGQTVGGQGWRAYDDRVWECRAKQRT